MAIGTPRGTRTRRPANITGVDGGTLTVSSVASLQNNAAGYATQGYATANQQYLHILVEETNLGGDTDADAVAVYGFCYAFDRWFQLGEQEHTGAQSWASNSIPTALALDPPNVTTTTAAGDHLPSSRKYNRFDIAGIDRIAVVATNDTRVVIMGATNSF